MNNNPPIPQRKSIRLPGYDYTLAGAYFITLVTWQRECLFGEIVSGEVRLSKLGSMVASEWQRLAKRFPAVELEEWVVMPNHFHGIIVLSGDAQRDHNSPTRESFRSPVAGSIPTILRSFKSSVTQWAKGASLGTAIWHRNYYEHVIRNEQEFDQIRLYIQENPRRWAEDEENLARP
jgi:putative transposase